MHDDSPQTKRERYANLSRVACRCPPGTSDHVACFEFYETSEKLRRALDLGKSPSLLLEQKKKKATKISQVAVCRREQLLLGRFNHLYFPPPDTYLIASAGDPLCIFSPTINSETVSKYAKFFIPAPPLHFVLL